MFSFKNYKSTGNPDARKKQALLPFPDVNLLARLQFRSKRHRCAPLFLLMGLALFQPRKIDVYNRVAISPSAGMVPQHLRSSHPSSLSFFGNAARNGR